MVGCLVLSVSESTPKCLSSLVIVSHVSVFLLVAVFSTMANGWPGLTRVILKKVEPKSKPITFAETGYDENITDNVRATSKVEEKLYLVREKLDDL